MAGGTGAEGEATVEGTGASYQRARVDRGRGERTAGRGEMEPEGGASGNARAQRAKATAQGGAGKGGEPQAGITKGE